MHQLDLTRAQRRRLEMQLRAATDVRVYRRTLASLEIADGGDISDIARMLRVSRQIVYRWLRLYTEAHNPAALVDRHRG